MRKEKNYENRDTRNISSSFLCFRCNKMEVLVVLFLFIDVIYGRWHQGMLEKVKKSLIDSTLKDISPVQCQLRCGRKDDCAAVAYKQLGIGKLITCFFLKESSNDDPEETNELFVVRKVFISYF